MNFEILICMISIAVITGIIISVLKIIDKNKQNKQSKDMIAKHNGKLKEKNGIIKWPYVPKKSEHVYDSHTERIDTRNNMPYHWNSQLEDEEDDGYPKTCEECKKELDSGAMAFQIITIFVPSQPAGHSENWWRKVNIQRRRELKRIEPQGNVRKERILCSSCAKKFSEEITEKEWRGALIQAILMIIILFGFIIWIIIHLFT